MKWILALSVVLITAADARSQNAGGTSRTGRTRVIDTAQSAAKKRGTGQYYGSRDTTPGSPMGTGGTGEGMSGAQAGSALETREHQTEVRDSLNNARARAGRNAGGKKTMGRKQ